MISNTRRLFLTQKLPLPLSSSPVRPSLSPLSLSPPKDPSKGKQNVARRVISYNGSGRGDGAFIREGSGQGNKAQFVLKQNTRGVWKVYQWDGAHMKPPPPTVFDDGDDI